MVGRVVLVAVTERGHPHPVAGRARADREQAVQLVIGAGAHQASRPDVGERHRADQSRVRVVRVRCRTRTVHHALQPPGGVVAVSGPLECVRSVLGGEGAQAQAGVVRPVHRQLGQRPAAVRFRHGLVGVVIGQGRRDAVAGHGRQPPAPIIRVDDPRRAVRVRDAPQIPGGVVGVGRSHAALPVPGLEPSGGRIGVDRSTAGDHRARDGIGVVLRPEPALFVVGPLVGGGTSVPGEVLPSRHGLEPALGIVSVRDRV
ncbi:MAG: hypothetical protein BWX44_01408 [Spirochaetes bacterium ADurb.Bin001]|nr:MAG: hypothetical protein BWX44_01408 [Spirochaetes bacterium ADurb.Bin001]